MRELLNRADAIFNPPVAEFQLVTLPHGADNDVGHPQGFFQYALRSRVRQDGGCTAAERHASGCLPMTETTLYRRRKKFRCLSDLLRDGA